MTCYRHPDREAYVRCQRCERFICPDCQVEAAVGFLCPDDAGQTGFAAAASRAVPRSLARRINSGTPVVTWALIIACTLVYGLQQIPGLYIYEQFVYVPLGTIIEPWRALTAGFLHGSIIHLLVNMYSLYIFGGLVEQMLGRARYLALYVISIFGGSVAVLWLSDVTTQVVGASGAIFGLMAAYFVIARRLGANTGQLTGLIAINLVIGFMPGSNISWQAHIGGLIAGGLVAYVYTKTRGVNDTSKRRLTVGLIVAGLVGLAILGAIIHIPSNYLGVF